LRLARVALPIAALLAACVETAAAPRVPASDAEVVERLPTRAADPASKELRSLRARWQRDPADAEAAAAFAEALFDEAAASGDPRPVGRAQAVLARWWDDPAPPPRLRVVRAMLRQYGHGFDAARADLDAVVAADPGHAQAWSWLAAIHLVRADYVQARRACEALAPLVAPLVAAACTAQVDAITGNAARAAAALRKAIAEDTAAEPAQRLWVLTRLAETEERRGDFAAAETAFRDALATGVPDVYLRAAHADFLLDRGRAQDVLELLEDGTAADVLLLRLALAARAAGDPRRDAWARELAARFDSARARGDTTHEKEEARFALALQGDAPRALALAQRNWAAQREVADARILLEAALAARSPQAAEPVLQWVATARVESVALQGLADQLRALRR
jgi:Tfp pilus assembly protein PilF